MLVYAQQNDNLDLILYRHLGDSRGYLEQCLQLNPQLSANAVLAIGTPVKLPEQPATQSQESIQLWS